MNGHEQDGRRRELRKRLRELEHELTRLHGELVGLGPGEALPGLFLTIEAGDKIAAVPSPLVLEVVRLVKTTPLPEAPAHVVGTFLYRGEPAVAIDLVRFLGDPAHQPDVDAHMVVLATARPVALIVDRVRALVEAPRVAEAPKDAPDWFSSPIVAALCHAEGELWPVLRVEPLLEGIPT